MRTTFAPCSMIQSISSSALSSSARFTTGVAQALLHEARERPPHHRAVDAELVHDLDARLGGEEPFGRTDRLAQDLAPRLAVGVAVLEVLLLRARRGHHVER